MTRKQLRIVRRIFSAIGVLGFFLLLGTAGASDLDTISGSRILWQSLIGITMFYVGGYLGGWMK